MSTAMRNRLMRLERALGASDALPLLDLPTLSAEECSRALAAAAPFAGGETGGVVITIDRFVPRESAEAVEQARALWQAALDLGWARLGYQKNAARYLAAALPAMLPEPRSPEVAQMVEILQGGGLPLLCYVVTPAIDGRCVPDGWRPGG